MHRITRIAALSLMLLTVVAAPSGAEAKSSSRYNATDAAFAAMMLPHHQGGVELGKLAAQKGNLAAIRELGQNIVSTQTRQAKTLQRMVRRFHTSAETVPEIEQRNKIDMAKLQRASGTDFDRSWLDVISAHHMSAIMMARMEVRGGRNRAARNLARRIVKQQRSELAQFNALTEQLGG